MRRRSAPLRLQEQYGGTLVARAQPAGAIYGARHSSLILRLGRGSQHSSLFTRDDGYDVSVTGSDGRPAICTDHRQHSFAGGRKPKHVRGMLYSGAAGRSQRMVVYRDQLRLSDFGPLSQDAGPSN